jgi:SanA protein
MEKTQKLNMIRSKRWIWIRRGICGALLFISFLLGFTWYANVTTSVSGEGQMYEDASLVSDGRVGLVFGCNPRVAGRENLYFTYRMVAAETLWKAGKVKGFIVSGDNSRESYNEPDAMKEALVARGVPVEKIVCDYAGLRTFDSVVRAKQIFGVRKVVFVSQRFQNERAQYMAKQCEIDAISFVAKDLAGRGGLKTKLREVLARPKMVLDFKLLATEPKYLGEREILPF